MMRGSINQQQSTQNKKGRLKTRAWVLTNVFALSLAVGCGDCSDPSLQNNDMGLSCPVGQQANPITGDCEPTRLINNFNSTTKDSGANNDSSSPMDMGRDIPALDMPATMVDVGMGDKCKDGIDSDNDGLDNKCECDLMTDPGNSDTDGDGLPDGFEDANKNCSNDVIDGETDPRQEDTDGDGLKDGEELRIGTNPLSIDTDDDRVVDAVEVATCLDPTKADTDGDGLDDGTEDVNKDGELGTCMNRMYAPGCANGEYDPCKDDTDGDGTLDGDEVNFLDCRQEFLDQLPAPNLITNNGGNYLLAMNQGLTSAPVMGLTTGNADAFNDPMLGYAGMVGSFTKPNGSNVDLLREMVLSRLKTKFPSAAIVASGRRTSTHDGFAALSLVKVNLGVNGGSPASTRDDVIASLGGVGSVSHSATGMVPNGSGETFFVFGVIDRPGMNYVISGAVVPKPLYEDNTKETGFSVDDLAGSMSVAKVGDMLVNECISFAVEDKPQVDFIWIIDGSGSMSEENNLVKNYANDFVNILNQRNIDWRLGVVSSNCNDIQNDAAALPPELRSLFVGQGLTAPCPAPPFGFGNQAQKNGLLCSKGNAFFTKDPAKFRACIDEMAGLSFSTEYTVTMGAAAVHRALPRAMNDPKKLRPNAATVIISVTDEFDDYIQSKMGWRDAGGSGDTPHDPSTEGTINTSMLESVVQPFVNYFLRAEVAATVFGIYWLPGQSCPSASEAAAGIDRVVNKTGGTAGNICNGMLQPTLEQIAEASAGLASSLRLRGIPIPSSIVTRVGQVATQQIVMSPRSRTDGWDYDVITNAITFVGASRPQTDDRVVVSYKRWANSIRQCESDKNCPTFQKFRCIEGECR